MDMTLSHIADKLLRLDWCAACIRMAEASHRNRVYGLQSKKRAVRWSDGQLEDNWRFGRGDTQFTADFELLFTSAVLGRGRRGRGFRLSGWRTALAVSTLDHPSLPWFFPSLSWDALPGASKQDRNRTAGFGDNRRGSSSPLPSGHC
jgi:hypothetical protein